MLGDDTGNVVIDHDNLVHETLPLGGEHADGGRAAAHPHALFTRSVDHRRLSGLHDNARAPVNGQFHRLLVAQIEHRLARDATLRLRSAGQVMHAAEREHLAAIFGGGDMAHRFAIRPHGGRFGPQMAVCVDLHLHAAIGEDALRHHRDEIDTFHLLRNDERGRFVVRIGGARAHRAHEAALRVDQFAIPWRFAFKGDNSIPLLGGMFKDRHRITSGNAPAEIAIAVAGTRAPLGDIAHHRAGIAAQLFVRRLLRRRDLKTLGELVHHPFSRARIAARMRLGVAGTFVTSTPTA